jgi:hypothetical protein
MLFNSGNVSIMASLRRVHVRILDCMLETEISYSGSPDRIINMSQNEMPHNIAIGEKMYKEERTAAGIAL